MGKVIKFRNRSLDCSIGTRIMGILNVTPDSFSDGGNYSDVNKAVQHALKMISDGADVIDIGGESTRPGAPEISVEEEIKRTEPVIKQLRAMAPELIISIDTRKSDVARVAVKSGADIINDVSGLEFSADMAEAAAESGAGLIIMHMRGTPANMQSEENLIYNNVISEVADALDQASEKAIATGVEPEKIIWDPGIGFSKTLKHNLELLGNIDKLMERGYAVLGGTSRKSFIGTLLNEAEPCRRVWGTGGSVAWLAAAGIDLVRVHDVAEIKQLVTVFEVCRNHKS